MIKIFILASFILTCAVGEEARFECPEANIVMGIGTYFQDVPDVASWEDCGRICALTTTCKYWSWGKEEAIDGSANICYLYENDASLEFNNNYVSGELGCPEDRGCKEDF